MLTMQGFKLCKPFLKVFFTIKSPIRSLLFLQGNSKISLENNRHASFFLPISCCQYRNSLVQKQVYFMWRFLFTFFAQHLGAEAGGVFVAFFPEGAFRRGGVVFDDDIAATFLFDPLFPYKQVVSNYGTIYFFA